MTEGKVRTVLVINKMYPPDIGVGGVETVARQYAEWVADVGCHVVVLSCSGTRSLITHRKQDPSGVEVYRTASLGTLWSLPVSPVFLLWFVRLARRADVVHFHEPFPLGSLASMLIRKRKRWLVTWHSDVVKAWGLRVTVELFQRLLLARADKVTTTSPALAANSKLLRKVCDRTEIIPLSVPWTSPPTAMPESLADQALPRRYQLFLGRLSAYKGIDVLLEAVRRIEDPSFKLVVAGAGECGELVRGSSKELNDRLIFLDRFVTEAEKNWLLAHCEVFLMPSTLASEAFGIMQLEAMQFGRPVINTSLPTGVPWVSKHEESGLTVTPGDPVELADAMRTLWEGDLRREQLGRGARQRFLHRFDNKVVRENLLRAVLDY